VPVALTAFLSAQGGDPNYGKPKRLNKMIELLAAGQPVYDVGVSYGGYEEGKKLAQTSNDVITYEMEHGPFEPQRLREFMQGLVDGGPTKSGHRMPTVVVTLPLYGLDAAEVRANHWVIEQVLSRRRAGSDVVPFAKPRSRPSKAVLRVSESICPPFAVPSNLNARENNSSVITPAGNGGMRTAAAIGPDPGRSRP
jgi:hypothetical protein